MNNQNKNDIKDSKNKFNDKEILYTKQIFNLIPSINFYKLNALKFKIGQTNFKYSSKNIREKQKIKKIMHMNLKLS